MVLVVVVVVAAAAAVVVVVVVTVGKSTPYHLPFRSLVVVAGHTSC